MVFAGIGDRAFWPRLALLNVLSWHGEPFLMYGWKKVAGNISLGVDAQTTWKYLNKHSYWSNCDLSLASREYSEGAKFVYSPRGKRNFSRCNDTEQGPNRDELTSFVPGRTVPP